MAADLPHWWTAIGLSNEEAEKLKANQFWGDILDKTLSEAATRLNLSASSTESKADTKRRLDKLPRRAAILRAPLAADRGGLVFIQGIRVDLPSALLAPIFKNVNITVRGINVPLVDEATRKIPWGTLLAADGIILSIMAAAKAYTLWRIDNRCIKIHQLSQLSLPSTDEPNLVGDVIIQELAASTNTDDQASHASTAQRTEILKNLVSRESEAAERGNTVSKLWSHAENMKLDDAVIAQIDNEFKSYTLQNTIENQFREWAAGSANPEELTALLDTLRKKRKEPASERTGATSSSSYQGSAWHQQAQWWQAYR
jgi:hypothetical protein